MERSLNLASTMLTANFFPSELVLRANELATLSAEEKKARKADIDAFTAELKTEYRSLVATIKGERKAKFAAIKETYLATLAEIEAVRKEGVDNENAAFAAIENPDEKAQKEHKNVIAGVEIVAKRASKKALNDYDEAIKVEKLRLFDLHEEYVAILRAASGKAHGLEGMKSTFIESSANFNFRKAVTNSKTWFNLVPLFMLIILITAYAIAGATTPYNGDLGDVINNGIFVAVVATGAVFIYSQGGFDMSLGNASLMCAVVATLTWNGLLGAGMATAPAIGITLAVSLVLGAVLGIINAVLATVLNLPVMVMTLTMMNILTAVSDAIFNNNGGLMHPELGLLIDKDTTSGEKAAIYAIFLVVFFILCWLIFNFTKVGRRNKFIGSNRIAAKFNGINLMTAGIVSFAISGLGLGICGFLFASSQSGHDFLANTPLSQVGLNVVIAIVFGGMTTSGGPKSKISCAIIGAFFSVFLDELFAALNTVANIGDYSYMVKGIIFLIVCLANMWDTRGKMLASGGSIQ